MYNTGNSNKRKFIPPLINKERYIANNANNTAVSVKAPVQEAGKGWKGGKGEEVGMERPVYKKPKWLKYGKVGDGDESGEGEEGEEEEEEEGVRKAGRKGGVEGTRGGVVGMSVAAMGKKRVLVGAINLGMGAGVRTKEVEMMGRAGNVGVGSATVDGSGGGTEGAEWYYNVLWRKYTTKKHKTFDGDGVLVVTGGYAVLQDLSGRDIGKSMCNKPLEPGSQFSLGGKEVEIDSVLSKADYLAGKPFLRSTVMPNIVPKAFLGGPPVVKEKNQVTTKNESGSGFKVSSMTTHTTTSKQFKIPLLVSTVLPKGNTKDPLPRHDPHGEDALVMPRPVSAPSGKRIVDVVVDPFIATHLRPHQREGVRFLYEAVMGLKSHGCYGAILADDMGLGKTLQTIALLWTLMKQNPIYETNPIVKKALVVCPVTLIKNWKKEFRKWLGNERIGVFVVGEDERKKVNVNEFTKGKVYNVMIVGYERLQRIQGELKKADIDIVIADEGHRLKTEKNKAAQAIRALNTKRRVILSGTPLQNDLHEFFIMVDFVNPGLLDSYSTFRRTFENPIVKSRQPGVSNKDVEKGKARGDELSSITRTFILRRTADLLSKYLPPKLEYIVFCRPSSIQLSVYRNILESPAFVTCLANPQASLQLITLLKKVCNSPALLASKDGEDDKVTSILPNINVSKLRAVPAAASGKLRVLDRMLMILRQTTDEKVVLVSNYTSTLDLLQKLLRARGFTFLRLDGSTPSSKRQDLVDQFNRVGANSAFAFLLSAKSGGAGINLIGASRLVLYDCDWNPATDHQAMARIHRDGQRREVKIYRLITTGCIDEKIYQRQLTKQGLAESVMDQKSSGSSFTQAELRDLFTLDETTDCQTHDLLGCDCEGKGYLVDVASSTLKNRGCKPDAEAGESPDKCQSKDGDDDNDDSYDDDGLPIFPGLMKASKVDVEKIEMDFRNSRTNIARMRTEKQKKKEQLSSLFRYKHFKASRLVSPANSTAAITSCEIASTTVGHEGSVPTLGRNNNLRLRTSTSSSAGVGVATGAGSLKFLQHQHPDVTTNGASTVPSSLRGSGSTKKKISTKGASREEGSEGSDPTAIITTSQHARKKTQIEKGNISEVKIKHHKDGVQDNDDDKGKNDNDNDNGGVRSAITAAIVNTTTYIDVDGSECDIEPNPGRKAAASRDIAVEEFEDLSSLAGKIPENELEEEEEEEIIEDPVLRMAIRDSKDQVTFVLEKLN